MHIFTSCDYVHDNVSPSSRWIEFCAIRAIRSDLGELVRLQYGEPLPQREKLGSTGVGNGIAIPHGKLPKLTKLFGLFARLERPVAFESLDGPPGCAVFFALRPAGCR